MGPLTVRLAEVAGGDLARVGGKGANLGELWAAGVPVPDAFVVTTAAYEQFVDGNALGASIAEDLARIDYAAVASVDAAASRIRAAFVDAPVPQGLADEIVAAYRSLSVAGESAVSVRSSATAEDLPGASFAGQQDTYLHVRGEADVVDAVRRCWASLWTARAIAYRHGQGFAHDDVRLAVVVQEMFASQVAGVLFTANPLTANPFEFVVNASWGLGEAVVSGLVDPDQLSVAREGLAVTSRTIGAKAHEVVPAPDGRGTQVVDVAAERSRQQALADEYVAELCRIGLAIEEHYGFPQDVEWGWADGRFAILQAREITGADLDFGHELETWKSPRALADMYDERWVWSRAYSDDVQTGPSTPSFYTYLQAGMTSLKVSALRFTDTGEVLGYSADEFADIPYFRWYGARAYYNLAFERERIRRFIPPFARDDAALWPFPEPERAEIRDLPFDWPEFWNLLWRLHTERYDVSLLGTTAVLYDNLERWTDDEDAFWSTYGLEDASVDEIFAAQLASRRGSRFGENVVLPFTIYLFMLPQALRTVCAEWLGDDGTLYERLVSGIVTKTSEENGELWDLSRSLRATPGLAAAVAAEPDDDAVLAALRADPQARPFVERLDRFLAGHGHRGGAERDAFHPRWRDRPSLVLRSIRPLVGLDDDADPRMRDERAVAAVRAARSDAVSRLSSASVGALRASFFEWLVDLVRDYVYYRDFERFFNDRTMSRSRVLYEAIGRRFVRAGLLSDPEDVFFLGRQEMSAADNGRLTARQVALRVASRRRVYERYSRREPPKYIQGWRFFDDDTVAGDGLAGIGASGGVVTGRARVCRDLADIVTLERGDILVTVATDPGWTTVFALIGGVVVETGGVVAHAVMIAREYGLPCVSNLTAACDRIPDGATVTMDGRTGVVQVHADPMVEVSTTRRHDFAVAAAAVWSVLSDFGGIGAWWPGGFVLVATQGAGAGMVRILERRDGSLVRETLRRSDADARVLELSIDAGLPEQIVGYRCRYEVVPTGPSTCRLDWRPSAQVTADGAPVFEATVERGWATLTAGLSAAVSP